jgi:glycosyltransferase involved in cell wall biosynthesis
MHIPWKWIKQRPHFLAEELSEYYQVDVYYKKSTMKLQMQNQDESLFPRPNLSINNFWRIPFKRIPILKHLNLDFINTLILFISLPRLKNYDYILIPTPELYDMVKGFLPSTIKILYDCMDDYVAFGDICKETSEYQKQVESEKGLINRSSLVICSAESLKNTIYNRAGLVPNNCIVVNNAIEIPSIKSSSLLPDAIKKVISEISKYPKSLLYIGAISEWFDFDAVMAALSHYDDLHVVLVGPIPYGSRICIPKHPRLHLLGPINRNYLFNIMPIASILIMPFKVIELVKSVNPVKLYEYIYSGKPIIASRYAETEKFDKYVSLYSTSEEFVSLINDCLNKKNRENYCDECLSFVTQNTWKKRVLEIYSYLVTNSIPYKQ